MVESAGQVKPFLFACAYMTSMQTKFTATDVTERFARDQVFRQELIKAAMGDRQVMSWLKDAAIQLIDMLHERRSAEKP